MLVALNTCNYPQLLEEMQIARMKSETCSLEEQISQLALEVGNYRI
jgi:hypothetical protein